MKNDHWSICRVGACSLPSKRISPGFGRAGRTRQPTPSILLTGNSPASAMNLSHPRVSTNSLSANVNLVRKVGPALPNAGFVLIGRRGGSAAHELAGDMPPQASVGQRINDFADSGCCCCSLEGDLNRRNRRQQREKSPLRFGFSAAFVSSCSKLSPFVFTSRPGQSRRGPGRLAQG